jgi:transposase-like protein
MGCVVKSCQECPLENCSQHPRKLPPSKPLFSIPDHVETVAYMKVQTTVETVVQPTVETIVATVPQPPSRQAPKRVKCPRCRSVHLVKRGFYKWKGRRKQLLYCLDCGRKFVQRPQKPTREIKEFALRQLASGNSPRVVSTLITQEYGRFFSLSTIREWASKPECPICHSTNTIKDETYRRARKYRGFPTFNADRGSFYCKNCGRHFVGDRENLWMKTPPKIIKFALKQIKRGKTLQAVSNLILEKYDIKRSAVSINKWKHRFQKKKSKKPTGFCWKHGYYEGASGCPKCRELRKINTKP